VDDWLVVLDDHVLKFLMDDILVVFMNHILVVLMNYILVMLFYDRRCVMCLNFCFSNESI
jgi:hypothetical protein